MKSISVLRYKDLVMNGAQENLNRLPFIQSGSLKVLREVLPIEGFKDNVLDIIEELNHLGTVSVNIVSEVVDRNEEVYVELYGSVDELVKTILIKDILAIRMFPAEYIKGVYQTSVLNDLKITDPIERESYVEVANTLCDALLEVPDYECMNIIDLVNACEKPSIKSASAFMYDIFNSYEEKAYSFVCSMQEFIGLNQGEFGEYLKVFAKSIQFKIRIEGADKCTGISYCPNKILPVFNIGGKVDSVLEVQDYALNLSGLEVIKGIDANDIDSYNKLLMAINRQCLMLNVEDMEAMQDLVIHELVEVLLNKHEYFGGDMYTILIDQAIKKFGEVK